MSTKKTLMSDVISHVDAAGEAAKKKLDSLWVPWDEETGSGGVHWHAAAASHLQSFLRDLADLRDRLVSADQDVAPDPEPEAPKKEAKK